MRIHLLSQLTFLLLVFFTSSSIFASNPYNPVVTISKVNDVVDYHIQNAGTGTHIFTLYGDGTCGNQNSPKHRFAPNAAGYTTEVYFAKPYQTNVPTLRTVHTGSITAGNSLYANPVLNMSGEIDVKTSWATAYNAVNFFIIAFKNEKLDHSTNGCIELKYHTNDLSIQFSGIREYNNWVFNRDTTILTGTYNRQIEWEFSNLAPGETRYVYVPAKVKVAVGNNVNVFASYIPSCREENAVNNSGSFKSRQYPHDPNYKIVDKPCLKPGVDQQYLEYTIGFFNDGNGFAHNVYLSDELSFLLDATSVSIIDAEYSLQWSIQNRALSIDFIGINLPGTNQISPKSYTYDDASTYVTFGICTESGLYAEECIFNEAWITFDQQDPYVTPSSKICCNTECIQYESCVSTRAADEETPELEQAPVLKVYPNPVKDHLQVQINASAEAPSATSIELMDYTGKRVRQLFQSPNTETSTILDQSFYIGDLPKGIYLLVVTRGGTVHTEKIVKL